MKKIVHICITESLCCTAEIDPQTENKLMVTKGKGWGGIN